MRSARAFFTSPGSDAELDDARAVTCALGAALAEAFAEGALPDVELEHAASRIKSTA
jgi:hypothetical protein